MQEGILHLPIVGLSAAIVVSAAGTETSLPFSQAIKKPVCNSSIIMSPSPSLSFIFPLPLALRKGDFRQFACNFHFTFFFKKRAMTSAMSTGSQLNQADDPYISWPLQRPTTDHDDDHDEQDWHPPKPVGNSIATTRNNLLPTVDPSNYPGGKKSLSGISIRAFILGTTLGVSVCLVFFTSFYTPLWRAPFFLAALCLFHFLEFYVTARYNTVHASVSAYLLTSNGWPYNAANISAFVECILAHLLHPQSYLPWTWTAPVPGVNLLVVFGLLLVALGQTVRTLAMAQAGSNFNHTVQVERKEGHTLVSTGVYAVFRHPSYFGFFWWALGTQLVLGNVICCLVHAVVLWRFFNNRIHR